VILAGGPGTRLRPLSCTRPKMLFPVANKPSLDWLLEGLSRGGVSEAILAVNYMADCLQQQVGNTRHGLKITYSREPKPLGTGGPVKYLEKLLRGGEESRFLILNGDVFADIDYGALIKAHNSYVKHRKATLTITLHEVTNPGRFGVVDIDDAGRVLRFLEKPKGVRGRRLINAGAYVAEEAIFRYIKEGRCSIEREVFPVIAKENGMYAYEHRGMWVDIGKPQDYLAANFKTLDLVVRGKPTLGKGVRVCSESDVVPPSVVGDEVQIGSGTRVGPYAVIGNNVNIERGCRIERSVIFNKTSISSATSVTDAVVGEGATLGRGVEVGRGCIIGDHVTIKNDVKLATRVVVCPFKEVEASILKPKYVV